MKAKNKLADALTVFGITAIALIIVGSAVWYEASVWSECRATNSFWYCMRVLSK